MPRPAAERERKMPALEITVTTSGPTPKGATPPPAEVAVAAELEPRGDGPALRGSRGVKVGEGTAVPIASPGGLESGDGSPAEARVPRVPVHFNPDDWQFEVDVEDVTACLKRHAPPEERRVNLQICLRNDRFAVDAAGDQAIEHCIARKARRWTRHDDAPDDCVELKVIFTR